MRASDLAGACLRRAWDDDTDDDSRELLEAAAVTIEQLATRCLRLAQEIERVEACQQEGRDYDSGM